MKIKQIVIDESDTATFHSQKIKLVDFSSNYDELIKPKILDLDQLTHEDYKEFIKSFHSTIWIRVPIAADEKGLDTSAHWLEGFFDKFYSFHNRERVSAGIKSS